MVIETVTGAINSSKLGRTLIHEHLRVRSEAVAAQFPHLYNEETELQKAMEQINKVKEKGIHTICDPTVMELGRDIRFMEKVAKQTGMQIIAATGIYSYYHIPAHFQKRTIDYMADLFIHDIEVGIQQTEIKAAFLKCAIDADGMTPDVEKVMRAVARAHKQTGRPIMTHSHPASESGLRQIEVFIEEGVDLSKVLIGHTGDTNNIDYIKRVLDYGVFIGMDRYGLTREISTEDRNDIVVELAKNGYANQMFLSQDYCCTIDWYPEGKPQELFPKWSMSFVIDEVIPDLLTNGVTQEQISLMMEDNARRWLSPRERLST